jgi:subtilisin family serine protease
VLVRFKSTADAEERARVRAIAGTTLRRTLPLSGLELDDPLPGASVGEVVGPLERSRAVLYAEPNRSRSATAVSSDPSFDQQWALDNTGQVVNGVRGTAGADIDAPQAWDLTTGHRRPVVAVLDSGIDYLHPDLQQGIWTNRGELGHGKQSNGVDDDRDGLVDDWRGWDWIDSDNDPLDANGHGTHVAGTIAARGQNGVGVAGVSWHGAVLPLRVVDTEGNGWTSEIVEAYSYAAAKGARVANVSLGAPGFSRAEHDAIAAARGTLFVVSAGNDGRDNDGKGYYPCSYKLDNVVCVAASDQTDARAPFSNFGARSVDLAAPGVNILSTWPGGGWKTLSGASMATAHVSGVASLILARRPRLPMATLKKVLLDSVDLKPRFAHITSSGGRLNAHRAVLMGDRALDITMSVRRRQRLPAVARRGVRLRALCSAPCVLHSTLVLGGRAAKRLRLGTGRRSVVVGAGRVSGGASVISVRLARNAMRRMTLVRSLQLAVRVSATAVTQSGSGRSVTENRTTETRRLVLSRRLRR